MFNRLGVQILGGIGGLLLACVPFGCAYYSATDFVGLLLLRIVGISCMPIIAFTFILIGMQLPLWAYDLVREAREWFRAEEMIRERRSAREARLLDAVPTELRRDIVPTPASDSRLT